MIVNYMIADDVNAAGKLDISDRITTDCIRLLEKGGISEYYGPHTAKPCGGEQFTSTAAMGIEILNNQEAA